MSVNYVEGIIARRFGYSDANAAAIAAVLSEGDRELIELASLRPGSSAEIAAVIMAARTRAANRLTDPHQRAAALQAATVEANRHYVAIRSERLPRTNQANPSQRSRAHRLRQLTLPDHISPEIEE